VIKSLDDALGDPSKIDIDVGLNGDIYLSTLTVKAGES